VPQQRTEAAAGHPSVQLAAERLLAKLRGLDQPVGPIEQLVDGLEGRKSLELISAIYESIETCKEVQLRFRPSLCRLGVGR